MEGQWAESPIDAEELRALPLPQAAATIVRWRPEPGDWPNSALELARTLETLVKDDAGGWVSEPVDIAVKLCHPTYISHYLQAVSDLAADTSLPVTELLDVIQLVWGEPWPPVPLGGSRLDYDTDWRGAKRSAMSLIRTLANADTDFGDRFDEAWDVIESAARDLSEPSYISDESDPLTRAINRSCTRAFETALLFVAAELRASRPLRPPSSDFWDSVYDFEAETARNTEPSSRHASPGCGMHCRSGPTQTSMSCLGARLPTVSRRSPSTWLSNGASPTRGY